MWRPVERDKQFRPEADRPLGGVSAPRRFICFYLYIGVWRSWLARTHGVREVAGSSPVTPINKIDFYRFYKVWRSFGQRPTALWAGLARPPLAEGRRLPPNGGPPVGWQACPERSRHRRGNRRILSPR